MTTVKTAVMVALVPLAMVVALQVLRADTLVASDPGVREGPAGAGDPLGPLSPSEQLFFDQGKIQFEEADPPGEGLGPRFNLDSCVGCHSQPASGGTSPFQNPQVAMATPHEATNPVPSFIPPPRPLPQAPLNPNPPPPPPPPPPTPPLP